MRISISIVASDAPLDTDFIPMDVFPDMSLNDVKALIQGEINIPPSSQTLFHNTQPIQDASKSLSDLGIGEGDMLALVIGNPLNTAREQHRRQPRSRRQENQGDHAVAEPDPERVRLQLLGDKELMERLRDQDPELANAAADSKSFSKLWAEKRRHQHEIEMEKERQIELLNADPFNVEAQKKIEEIIRQERVQNNINKALEDNPESFGRVNMLYIDCFVNNVPMKAFVDSGAQTTIMSPDAAYRCGISPLIDTRHSGIARGVGTAKIIGRVHSADIQIGQYSLASSFTVMEGKDVDLLLGLDMLKRHQMCIDLRKNCLRVQEDEVRFLDEHELPRMMDDLLEAEPKVLGPNGTAIGTVTGTVTQKAPPASPSQNRDSAEPAGPQTKAHPIGSSGNVPQNANASSSHVENQLAPTSRGLIGRPAPITQESIAKITELGFTREEAIAALRQVDGDIDMAVGLLL